MIDNFAPFDPSLIRNYHFLDDENGVKLVQFVAIGDRHRMMKNNEGKTIIIKEAERGKPYRYGDPHTVKEALTILDQHQYPTHADIAQHIRDSVS